MGDRCMPSNEILFMDGPDGVEKKKEDEWGKKKEGTRPTYPKRVRKGCTMQKKKRIRAGAAHTDVSTSYSIESLPTELLVTVLSHVADARSICRCSAASRRLNDIIAGDPAQLVWRRAAEQSALEWGIDGPWLFIAADAKGWPWVKKALEPLPEHGNGTGYARHRARVTVGEFEDHRLHGYTVLITPRDGWHCGFWHKDVRYARGVGTLSDGTRYDCDWQCGQKCGWGAVEHADGDTYEGEWKSDEYHGWGTYRLTTRGITCEGEWEYGRQNGRGTLGGDGVVVEGWFLDNMRHGRFTVRYANGDLFECFYYDDAIHGAARLVCSPDCPDPCFRSTEIASQAWVRADMPGEGLLSSMVYYPDPASSPTAFLDFCRYFASGLAHVPDRLCDAMRGVLSDAARRVGLADPII